MDKPIQSTPDALGRFFQILWPQDDQRKKQDQKEFERTDAQEFHIPLAFFYRVNYL
jgi:hypothetical protein